MRMVMLASRPKTAMGAMTMAQLMIFIESTWPEMHRSLKDLAVAGGIVMSAIPTRMAAITIWSMLRSSCALAGLSGIMFPIRCGIVKLSNVWLGMLALLAVMADWVMFWSMKAPGWMMVTRPTPMVMDRAVVSMK